MTERRSFAEVWNEHLRRAVATVNDNEPITDIEEDDELADDEPETAPEISDTGQHPEVANQPDPGATE